MTALALGIEIQCRLSNVLLLLLLPPAKANLGFYVTGPIGATAALGRLLRLNEQRMVGAIGLAAAQSSGFCETHGTMAAGFVPAQAARSGASAAILAAKGFTCSNSALESEKGFVGAFSSNADLGRATGGLGRQFEMVLNAYKPYRCGIVIHPAIDACLDTAGRLDSDAVIAFAALKVHSLALTLTGRREPSSPLEAQVSLFHWAAAAFVHRSAGGRRCGRPALMIPRLPPCARRSLQFPILALDATRRSRRCGLRME